jgi:hypothetical protein
MRRALVVTFALTLGAPLLTTAITAASSGATSTASATPRVLSVHPHAVDGRGGTTILVLGSGYVRGTVITVGGRPGRVRSVRNAGALYAAAPRGIGTEVVRAVTPDGASARNARSVLRYDNRVLVVGDSMGIDLGWGFSAALDAHDGLSVTDDAVGSSGLVRTDYYDWPSHLRDDLTRAHADVVVTLFGTNDEQAFATPNGVVEPGTAAWDRIYAARVRQIAGVVRRAGATLVWVGLPRMGPRSSLSQPFVAHLVKLDRSVVATLRGATFVNAWPVFTTASGAYTPYVQLAPHVWVLGHSGDATHLTPAGATVIVARAMKVLRRYLTRR